MAQVRLNTIIDINGLIDYYKDNSSLDWGTKDTPCNADPFYNLMSSQCSFKGQNVKIPIWESEREYVWRLRHLDEEYPLVKGDDSPEVNIILEMPHQDDYVPVADDWKKIFVWDEHFSLESLGGVSTGKLRVSETSTHLFKFKTQIQSVLTENVNLTYSIKFSFFGIDKIRYGKIDPFISVRSDDPNALL